jgi:hypothetical protein
VFSLVWCWYLELPDPERLEAAPRAARPTV